MILVLCYIEKKCSKLNAVFKVVKINFGTKFGALVYVHTAALQHERRGRPFSHVCSHENFMKIGHGKLRGTPRVSYVYLNAYSF